MYSCTPKYILVEIHYLDGSIETLKTQEYIGCDGAQHLQNSCTNCLVDTRCGVRSVKILKYL
jgi:hypothetical protein